MNPLISRCEHKKYDVWGFGSTPKILEKFWFPRFFSPPQTYKNFAALLYSKFCNTFCTLNLTNLIVFYVYNHCKTLFTTINGMHNKCPNGSVGGELLAAADKFLQTFMLICL